MSDIDLAKQRILAAVSLEALMVEGQKGVRKGRHMVILCPFHEDSNPSCYLYGDHYHCFSCQAHGDAIDYVRHKQGLGFVPALKWLADRFGVVSPELEQTEKQKHQWKQQARIGSILVAAQEFFQHELQDREDVLKLLADRGFDREKALNFGFGVAPPRGEKLIKHLEQSGYRDNELVEASLMGREGRRSWPFFIDRFTIPIRDLQGRIIAFGGRTLCGHQQKYKNSRYDKGTVLFGMHEARSNMRKSGAIVVEGYMDALQMWNHGFPEAVACQGTALTRSHLNQIANAAEQVTLLFDGDAAGRRASLKLVEDALNYPNLKVRVAELPDGQDPDSFLQSQGAEALHAVLDQAKELLNFAITSRLRGVEGVSIPATLETEILPWIRTIDDPLRQGFLLSQVSAITGISQTALTRSRSTRTITPSPVADPAPIPRAELSQADREILAALFFCSTGDFETHAATIKDFCRQSWDLSSPFDEFVQEMLNALESGKVPAEMPFETWQSGYDPAISSFFAEKLRDVPADQRPDKLVRLILHQQSQRIKLALKHLKEQLSRLQPENDQWQDLARSFQENSRSLKELDKNLRSL